MILASKQDIHSAYKQLSYTLRALA